jgi:hypothetical protein
MVTSPFYLVRVIVNISNDLLLHGFLNITNRNQDVTRIVHKSSSLQLYKDLYIVDYSTYVIFSILVVFSLLALYIVHAYNYGSSTNH